MNIRTLIWNGFWQGLGIELSFALLWALWHFGIYQHVSNVHPEHILHKIHDYFK